MTKDDLKHPAWPLFLEHVDEVALACRVEDAWNTYKAGYEAALKSIVEAADKKAKDEAEWYDEEKETVATGETIERPAKMKLPPTETISAALGFTCARCPNPKKPDPKFHPDGGLAHVKPKPDNSVFTADPQS